MEYLYVGAGGMVGALARYAISKYAGQKWKYIFPAATFFINLSGSFALGYLYIFFSQHSNWENIKSLTTTGFLGAFTTYSTFTFEIINLLEKGGKWTAVKYFSSSIVLGVVTAFLGMLAAQNL